MKFMEMRKIIEDNKEYGFRFMIADEMKYVIEKDGAEVSDDLFEELCMKAERAYLKMGDITFEMWQLCKITHDMSKRESIENISPWYILEVAQETYCNDEEGIEW